MGSLIDPKILNLFVRHSFAGVSVFKPTLTLRIYLNFHFPPLHCPLFVRGNSFNKVLFTPQFVISSVINFYSRLFLFIYRCCELGYVF